MLVKEYMNESTHIRLFDDYCNTEENNIDIKNTIVSLLLRNLKNNFTNDLRQ